VESTPPAADIRVRVASARDAARLSLLGSATFLESYAWLLPADDIVAHVAHQHAQAVYARWLEDSRCHGWIAEVQPGCAPVGYLIATPPDLPLPDLTDADLEIRRIYLLHPFQRAGIGRQLMELVMERARQCGKRRLLLGVYSRNADALAFYARLGFTEAGTRRFRVGAHDYFDYILQCTT
jgi:diamine N-acetyltransferase